MKEDSDVTAPGASTAAASRSREVVALMAHDIACCEYPRVDQAPLRDAFVKGAVAAHETKYAEAEAIRANHASAAEGPSSTDGVNPNPPSPKDMK